MLSHSAEKVKEWVSENKTDLFTAAIIFLIGMASFGLGRLSVSLPQKEPIRLEDPASSEERTVSSTTPTAVALKNGSFVASKSGSVYYAVWCSGVSRIREENKVWFKTKEDAKAQGYRPAKNCPGL
ncbi:MAG: hypothetical protein HY007_00330 [Candidatus Sungbacteria bacterium]|nr:hypothetical protein [Candidatus Sungbacteria bacterium]